MRLWKLAVAIFTACFSSCGRSPESAKPDDFESREFLFADSPPLSPESQRQMDPQKVPEPLHSMLPFVQRWGAVASDSERYAVADYADFKEERIAEVEAWATAWTRDSHTVYEKWESNTQLTESYELCKFYFLFLLGDELEIEYPQLKDERSKIDKSIAELKIFEGIGADAGRMWAARDLCDYEAEAVAAVPALEVAINDPVPKVRAWAHAALASITGKQEPHRSEIKKILKSTEPEKLFWVEPALEDLEKSSESRLINRLRSATILSDLKELNELVRRIDVNLLDHNDSAAIESATGNRTPDSMEILLKAGANPNQRCRHSNRTLLHMVAPKRKGHLMIELLLRYGADPFAVDNDGDTALDIAIAKRRTKSITLLEAAMKKK